MIPVEPKPDQFLLPADGVTRPVYGANQPEYIPLPSIKLADGRVVTQWQLEPNERLLIANGAPITLMLHTYNMPLQPIVLTVGGLDLR